MEEIKIITKTPEGHLQTIATECQKMTDVLDTVPHGEVGINFEAAIGDLYAACQRFKVALRDMQNGKHLLL